MFLHIFEVFKCLRTLGKGSCFVEGANFIWKLWKPLSIVCKHIKYMLQGWTSSWWWKLQQWFQSFWIQFNLSISKVVPLEVNVSSGYDGLWSDEGQFPFSCSRYKSFNISIGLLLVSSAYCNVVQIRKCAWQLFFLNKSINGSLNNTKRHHL